jgi:hypothetical protein
MEQLSIHLPNPVAIFKKWNQKRKKRNEEKKILKERRKLKPYDPKMFQQMENQINHLLEEHSKTIGERDAVLTQVNALKYGFDELRKNNREQHTELSAVVMDHGSKVMKLIKQFEERLISIEVRNDQEKFDWRNEMPPAASKRLAELKQHVDTIQEELHEKINQSGHMAMTIRKSLANDIEKIRSITVESMSEQATLSNENMLKAIADIKNRVDEMFVRLQSIDANDRSTIYNNAITKVNERMDSMRNMLVETSSRMDSSVSNLNSRYNALCLRFEANQINTPPGEVLPTSVVSRILTMERERETNAEIEGA